MPLPFSFSTQRQSSEAESPAEAIALAIAEKMMSHAPAHVSTEPLQGTQGSIFTLPALETVPRSIPDFPRPAEVNSVALPFRQEQEAVLPPQMNMTAVVPPPTSQQGNVLAHDLPAQIDQLRNDIFGIAMNVSAMNDRIDRLEQRLPQAGQSAQAGIATLRGEIETWLENHLNAAVEHCMNQIINRANSSVN
jgi:hypothetical protein